MADKDKAPITPILDTPSDELVAIELEMKKLQLEQMKLDLGQARRNKASREETTTTREDALNAERDIKTRNQVICNHRKGGLNVEGLTNGEDNKYAISKHQYPSGDIVVMCLRCFKEWHPKDEGYGDAMRFPTDNLMSGSVTFTFPKAG